MVCDSTNVFVEGETGSEGEVREQLIKLIADCKQRVVVTTFASNLARVATIIHAAQDAGRVVALAGRSLHRVVDAAQESGYLDDGIEFVSDREVMNLPRQERPDSVHRLSGRAPRRADAHFARRPSDHTAYPGRYGDFLVAQDSRQRNENQRHT